MILPATTCLFPPQVLKALSATRTQISDLRLVDSLGIDFHKTGFAPYISSMVLFKERKDLQLLARPQEQAPYLFQFGEYRPGMFTLEGSRSGGGVLAALANLKLFGKQGLRILLAHLIEMTQLLREKLTKEKNTVITNEENFGLVTLFRLYPDTNDTRATYQREKTDNSCNEMLVAHNNYNRQVFDYLHAEAMAGKGTVLSLVDSFQRSDSGKPISALKSFIISPFTDAEAIASVITHIRFAKKHIDQMCAHTKK